MSFKTTPRDNFDPEISPAKCLFVGNIAEEQIFPYPTAIQADEAETLRIVLESIDKFMESNAENYREYDVKGEQPTEYLDKLRELGLFGPIIPEEYSGLGLSNAGYSRLIQQVAGWDASTSLTIGAHSSIGLKGLLLFGTEEQKAKYLPKLATGETLAAFCLTEAQAGSDAASIQTKATKNADGSWLLNGEKIWITNGPTADFFTVFAKTETEKGKMTAFIVDRSLAGVSSGPKEDKMGIRASATSTVTFEDVRVPAENVLSSEGEGFKVAMAILNNGRTGLGGGCVGGMKRCIQLSIAQANERKQFGKAISKFPLIKQKISQMGVDCFVTESVVSYVGSMIDSGSQNFSVEAAMSKIIASEAMWRTCNEALQIAGGNGFMREFPYERIVRDCRINMIFEGTNEILRLYIALSGLKETRNYLEEISESLDKILSDPIESIGELSGYVSKRFSQLTSLGRDKIELCHESLVEQREVFEKYVPVFSEMCESLLKKHRKKIIDEQLVLKRLADVAIDLFAGLCTISRVSQLIELKGEKETLNEQLICSIFSKQAKRRMNQNLRRLSQENEDNTSQELADGLISAGSYMWDTI